MTGPITGPFTKDEFLYDIPTWDTGQSVYRTYSLKRKWYRQARPYNLPLAFDSITRHGNSVRTSSGPYGNYYGSWVEAIAASPDFPVQDQGIYEKAYAKFVDKWKNAVELGVATAEGREAVGMVTHRISQIANFTRHLARGNIGLAANDLGISWTGDSPRRKAKRYLPLSLESMKKAREGSLSGREALRNFSSLYLEFHFGWSPLLKDIHDALTVLDEPFKAFHVKASASGSYPDPNNKSSSWSDGTWSYSESLGGTYEQTVQLRADLVVTNPNLAMLQSFGLANPISVAWELVPFSFLLDWFVTVGDYLDSLTDFAGVVQQNPTRTIFTRYTGNYAKYSIPFHPKSDNTVVESWSAHNVHCFRRLGLGTGPTIRLRAPKPLGIRRGLAAVSLLMQRFPRRVIDDAALTLAKKRTAFRGNVFPQFYGKYF